MACVWCQIAQSPMGQRQAPLPRTRAFAGPPGVHLTNFAAHQQALAKQITASQWDLNTCALLWGMARQKVGDEAILVN